MRDDVEVERSGFGLDILARRRDRLVLYGDVFLGTLAILVASDVDVLLVDCLWLTTDDRVAQEGTLGHGCGLERRLEALRSASNTAGDSETVHLVG